MSDERLRSPTGDWTLDRDDRVTAADRRARAAYRARGWLLCHLGRHYWAAMWNPDVGGPRARYDQCRRCGKERSWYINMHDLRAP
jgi:hypothetical protein